MLFTLRHSSLRYAPALAASSTLLLVNDVAYARETAAVDLQKVREAIVDVIESDAEKRGDGTSLYGTMIRLAWHCSGTYSQHDHSGGSAGGRMRFAPEASWGANAGLKDVAQKALEPVKAKFPELSYADLYTYAGVVAVEETGGPKIPFRVGRSDEPDGSTSPPDGRLPDADKGSHVATRQHIRDIFYRMGFNDQEIVALCGAHAMGRCHTDRSGYWGPWTNAENTFSNEYFRLLVEERWSPKVTHNGKPWEGPDQYENAAGNLMMLPSDIALIADPEFKKWVEAYAKDENLFFRHFSKAFSKLLELGVPFKSAEPWYKFW
ncbi:cytochrome c peroxidase [Fistulifera solaris]|uniref:Cytochrome c peroxidase, mitochondrial n=1 Tax=Fistulifera solaris TaxID=1519565 RepID=A0A1Z5KCP6_FISSO|nr:cytochrome c peroxidase [Fistulifera solaris]|eukprot:GAX24074.1 cytochrome c peroxidase [Fistulifera solaris]